MGQYLGRDRRRRHIGLFHLETGRGPRDEPIDDSAVRKRDAHIDAAVRRVLSAAPCHRRGG
jgi:hypothetical protein